MLKKLLKTLNVDEKENNDVLKVTNISLLTGTVGYYALSAIEDVINKGLSDNSLQKETSEEIIKNN